MAGNACPAPVLGSPPAPLTPQQIFVSTGSVWCSFTALTAQSPKAGEEVIQSSRMNRLKNVQLRDMWKPMKSAS